MLNRQVARGLGSWRPTYTLSKPEGSGTLTETRPLWDTARRLTASPHGTCILQQHVAAVVLLSQVQAAPLLLGQVHGHVLQGHRHLRERSLLSQCPCSCRRGQPGGLARPLLSCDDGRSCFPRLFPFPPFPFPTESHCDVTRQTLATLGDLSSPPLCRPLLLYTVDSLRFALFTLQS